MLFEGYGFVGALSHGDWCTCFSIYIKVERQPHWPWHRVVLDWTDISQQPALTRWLIQPPKLPAHPPVPRETTTSSPLSVSYTVSLISPRGWWTHANFHNQKWPAARRFAADLTITAQSKLFPPPHTWFCPASHIIRVACLSVSDSTLTISLDQLALMWPSCIDCIALKCLEMQNRHHWWIECSIEREGLAAQRSSASGSGIIWFRNKRENKVRHILIKLDCSV